MNNIKDGWTFEEKIIEILGEHGFWASGFPKDKDGNTQQAKSGQWIMTKTLANGTKPLI
jgi:predicted fused transcriptional regulator/phosphomethylpyrimidine kinase